MDANFTAARAGARWVSAGLLFVGAAALVALGQLNHRPSSGPGVAAIAPSSRSTPPSRTTTMELEKTEDGRSLLQAVTAARYAIEQAGAQEYEAANPAQGLQTRFLADGVSVRTIGKDAVETTFKVKSYGYGEKLTDVPSVLTLEANGNRMEYRHGEIPSSTSSAAAGLVEWYLNKPEGLEQGFTFSAPPPKDPSHDAATHEPLRLTLELSGDVRAEPDGATAIVLKSRDNVRVATYSHLTASDATGRQLAARIQLSGREIFLEVEDAGATYPVTIDPTVQGEIGLLAHDGIANDQLGNSVAISGDTAVVGAAHPASNSTPGAAYIFVRNGVTWTEQHKLEAGGNNGGNKDNFGSVVAISGDTVVIGDVNAYTDDGSFLGRFGAAFVFVRSDGSWPLQAKLLPTVTEQNDSFGHSVAISGDTIFVGAPLDNFEFTDSSRGAAYPLSAITAAGLSRRS